MDIISDGTAEGTIIYQYTPSSAAGWAFVVMFAATGVAHIARMFWHRTWYFVWMMLGIIMQAGCYYGRVWSHSDPKNFKAYVLYLLLNLGSIPFIAATIYMVLSRIITTLEAPHQSIIPPGWLTTIFVLIDIVTLVSQLIGAGLRCSISASTQEIGRKVVVGGLVFQIVCLAFFIFVAFRFHRSFAKRATSLALEASVHWKRHIYTLYIVGLLVVVRNIFKLVEYTQGHTGTIAHTEALVYVFDATLVWLITAIYVFVHPGTLLKQTRKVKKELNTMERQELTSGSEYKT